METTVKKSIKDELTEVLGRVPYTKLDGDQEPIEAKCNTLEPIDTKKIKKLQAIGLRYGLMNLEIKRSGPGLVVHMNGYDAKQKELYHKAHNA